MSGCRATSGDRAAPTEEALKLSDKPASPERDVHSAPDAPVAPVASSRVPIAASSDAVTIEPVTAAAAPVAKVVSADPPAEPAKSVSKPEADAAMPAVAAAKSSGKAWRPWRGSVANLFLLLVGGVNVLTLGMFGLAIARVVGGEVEMSIPTASLPPREASSVLAPSTPRDSTPSSHSRPIARAPLPVAAEQPTPPPVTPLSREDRREPGSATSNIASSAAAIKAEPPVVVAAAPPSLPPPAIVPPTSQPAVTTAAAAPTANAAATAQGTPAALPQVVRSESETIQRFDQFIAPARDITPSVDDALRIRDAFAAGSNVAQARALRDQITDPLSRKLVDWQLYRNGAGTAREIRSFLDANPDWPSKDLLNQRAEEQVFTTGGSAAEIKAFFAKAPPRTAIGEAALASAHLAEQNEAEATKLAAKVWRTGDIPSSLETGFIERFGKVLGEADHKWRLDRLLADDARWEGERRDRAAIIRRVIPFLSAPEQAKAQARLAVYMRTADASKLLGALPADAATSPGPDWGFALQLAQWHRRAGRIADAVAVLKDAPVDAAQIVSPDDWWEERRITAYEILKTGDAALAYELIRSPGELSVNQRKDATFLAGWIAFKFLNKPAEAIAHFRDLEKAADGPLSRGKAGFWLARIYQSIGDKEKTRAALTSAVQNSDTFYGMLAQQALDPGKSRIPVSPPRDPSDQELAAFNSRDAVKAAVLARKSGVDQSVTRVFLTYLRNTLSSESEFALLAHLAEALGDTQMAVRIGKSGIARGFNLVTYAYPIHAIPLYQPLRPPPEQALLLGVARQESEFASATLSGAGARGLLQVMPITAQHICKDYKLKCEIERLSSDPAYNLMMASAYIGDRMDEFNGSYVLTLAGYNAGPGRARQWIREFGDPRDPAVDPIDWIHRIPFEETREYLLKVLSNIQIYRARLGDEANALRLESDLRRTGNLKRAAAAGRN